MATVMTRADSSNGSIVREGFGESSIERRGETASTALAAQAQAEIQSRYVVARANPRSEDQVRALLLRQCQKSSFADKAYYSIPRGKDPGKISGTPKRLEGLSVRFAETAIRLSGNILQTTRTTYDDDFKRMVNVAVTDLETNAVYSRDVVIEKTVERSKAEDRVVLGQRMNSSGYPVYIVQCTEDELLQKEGVIVSKVFRTLALRLLPADTLEECEKQIAATDRATDARDPDAARKATADAFAKLNVTPAELEKFLGHPLAQCTPVELTSLRKLYTAIGLGDVTWAEARDAEKADDVTGEVSGESLEQKLANRAKAREEAKAKASGQDTKKAEEDAVRQREGRPAEGPGSDFKTKDGPTICGACLEELPPGEGIPTIINGKRAKIHPGCDPLDAPPEDA